MIYLSAALFAVLWLWSDLIGNLLSVVSTYFYFGWELDPSRIPKIFAIVFFAFSAPFSYRLIFYRWPTDRVIRWLTGSLFLLYISLSLISEPAIFAWGTVFAVWVGGLAMMAVFRAFRNVRVSGVFLYSIHCAFFFYLSTRISLSGLPLLLMPPKGLTVISWAIPLLIVVLGTFYKSDPSIPEETSSLPRSRGSLGWVFGLLMGLSLGLVYNLHIWSAATPDKIPAIYFLSMGTGLLLAWLLFRSFSQYYYLLLPLGGLALAAGLYILLYIPYTLALALPMHLWASLGLCLFWAYFLGRLQDYSQQDPKFFPWISYQFGFISLLLILALFLLEANPNGFWFALLVSTGLLLWHEFKQVERPLPKPELGRLWIYTSSLFALTGLLAFWSPPKQVVQAEKHPQISIMSTNVRYGWTDDYRFRPLEHLQFLSQQHPDFMGVQELNKGHTSGAYSDLFSLYQKNLDGHWYYGDAHFGFGNALMSRWPIKSIEHRVYQAKDMLKRSALIATVDYQGKTIRVFVTHLSHLAHPNPVRRAQMDELLGWINEKDSPWILMADFNAEPDEPEIQAIIKIAHPVFRSPRMFSEASFPSVTPDRRIDYVFFSSDFTPGKQVIMDNKGSSDHRPVWMEVTLPK